MVCQNDTKRQNVANLSMNNVQKFQKFTITLISRFGERWAYMKPDKSEQAFFNSREIAGHLDLVWIFFTDANIVVLSVDFLAWSFNIFCEITGI